MSETYAVSNLPEAVYFWTKCPYIAETKLDGGDINGEPTFMYVCIYFGQHSN